MDRHPASSFLAHAPSGTEPFIGWLFIPPADFLAWN